jgi:NADPH-dependent 2,4-dienoyl-CoA reductase/sulfur reductase-like enzyme/rhodanese-related sulfurtransferase
MSREIVVVGGGAAGLKAASRARRRDEEAEITVLEKGEYPSLGRCGLPYYVEGFVHDISNLMETLSGDVRDEEYFKKVKNINVLTKTEALSIDRKKRAIKISRNGRDDELNYDYLVLATGAKPVRLRVKGVDADGIFSLTSAEDALKITEMWMDDSIESAVIIGGGLIGLETAEALERLDIDVTIVELKNQLLWNSFDFEMAELVRKCIIREGVKVLTSTTVQEFITEDGKVKAVRANEKILPAELVIISIGVEPRTELAESAGLELTERGAIKVNEYLQTSDPFIYAGGDCVENINLLTGEHVYTPLGSTANKHGRIIGGNITGGRSKWRGVLCTSIFRVFNADAGRTGLTEKQAREAGFDPVIAISPGPDRAHYYPGFKPIRLKLIADRRTRKVLGAQAFGLGVIDKRIDVIATAIQMGGTVDDLAEIDLAYAPPFSSALDHVIHAANIIRNKLDGLVEGITPLELISKLEKHENVLILDVRNEKEFQAKRIRGNVLNIPLSELRERIDEIPNDKEIVTSCAIGTRAYEAARVLLNRGFKVRFLDGALATWVFDDYTIPS